MCDEGVCGEGGAMMGCAMNGWPMKDCAVNGVCGDGVSDGEDVQ